MVIVTEPEHVRLVEAMPEHYRPLTLFLAGTGMRWGEATALTWGDLDLRGSLPTARVTKAWKRAPGSGAVLGPPKTRKAVRTVSLWADLVSALGTPGPADQLVFRGLGRGDGASPGRVWPERYRAAAWRPALLAVNTPSIAHPVPIGKRPRVHDLRHSHASALLAARMPILEVSRRLGHESVSTTGDHYGHLMPESHERLADAAARGMRIALTPLAIDTPHHS